MSVLFQVSQSKRLTPLLNPCVISPERAFSRRILLNFPCFLLLMETVLRSHPFGQRLLQGEAYVFDNPHERSLSGLITHGFNKGANHPGSATRNVSYAIAYQSILSTKEPNLRRKCLIFDVATDSPGCLDPLDGTHNLGCLASRFAFDADEIVLGQSAKYTLSPDHIRGYLDLTPTRKCSLLPFRHA